LERFAREPRLDVVVERCHDNLSFFATLKGEQFANGNDDRLDAAVGLNKSRTFVGANGQHFETTSHLRPQLLERKPSVDRMPRRAVRSPKRKLIVIRIGSPLTSRRDCSRRCEFTWRSRRAGLLEDKLCEKTLELFGLIT